jgi:D-lactate dehydrogenase
VIAFDIAKADDLSGVQYCSLKELMEQSDIISLHCPLNPSTQYMINKDTIALMKEGVMIINTSRGKLINTKDTLEGLKKGKIGNLGIDVYEQEEKLFFKDLSENIIQDDLIARLISFPNVLITAHQGFFTHEALEQIARVTIRNANDFKAGIASGNEVLEGKA